MKHPIRSKRIQMFVGLVAILALLLSACAPVAAPAPSAGEAAPAEPLKIAFSIPGMSFPFFVHMETAVACGS